MAKQDILLYNSNMSIIVADSLDDAAKKAEESARTEK